MNTNIIQQPANKRKARLQWALHQKRWFGKWHLYVGIIAGAILCIVGVTGSILVFQDEIDAALNPSLYKSLQGEKRYTIGEVVPVIQQKYPGKPFDYIMETDRDNPNSTYKLYHYKTQQEFFVNPYNGTLCGKRLMSSSFIRIVTNIHCFLLVPPFGRYVVGLAALSMLILTISGLRLWVPGQYNKWKQWKAALTVNFKAGFKRKNYDWHSVLGFYSAPVVVMIALTGFAITFSSIFIASLFILTGKSPQSVAAIYAQKSDYKEGRLPLSPKAVSDIGKNTVRYGDINGIALPDDKYESYRLDIKAPGKAKSGKRIMLMIDQYTGKVLLNSETDFPNIGQTQLSWLAPIHYGTFGGMPTRILALLGGLMPLALYITGFIIWWPRLQKQKQRGNAIQPKATQNGQALAAIKMLPFRQHFSYYFTKGLKYAVLLICVAFMCGALYGLVAGIMIQPGLFSVLYVGISVTANFTIALLAFVFVILFLAPFKKTGKAVYKYFALSLAFLLVFLPAIVAIAKFSKDVF